MKRLVGAWIVVGVAVAMSSRLAEEYLWIMSLIPLLAWGVAGFALLGVTLWKAREAASRAGALRQAGAVIATAVLFPLAASLGGALTERIRFAQQRSSYDRIVAQAQGQKEPRGHANGGGLDYIVDPGPPVRVAFVWPGGIIDDWCGAVFDPTGEVMKVNDLPLGSTEWRELQVTKMFDGDLISCRRLQQPYYLCCFT